MAILDNIDYDVLNSRSNNDHDVLERRKARDGHLGRDEVGRKEKEELERVMRKGLGGDTWRDFFVGADPLSSGLVDFHEFRRLMRKEFKITFKMVSETRLQQIFSFFDSGNTGDGDGFHACCMDWAAFVGWTAQYSTENLLNSQELDLTLLPSELQASKHFHGEQASQYFHNGSLPSSPVFHEGASSSSPGRPKPRSPAHRPQLTKCASLLPEVLDTSQIEHIRKALTAHAYTMGGVDWHKLLWKWDRDHSGVLDFQEFEQLIRKQGKIVPSMVSTEKLEILFRSIDVDLSGEIAFTEFVAWIETPLENLPDQAPKEPMEPPGTQKGRALRCSELDPEISHNERPCHPSLRVFRCFASVQASENRGGNMPLSPQALRSPGEDGDAQIAESKSKLLPFWKQVRSKWHREKAAATSDDFSKFGFKDDFVATLPLQRAEQLGAAEFCSAMPDDTRPSNVECVNLLLWLCYRSLQTLHEVPQDGENPQAALSGSQRADASLQVQASLEAAMKFAKVLKGQIAQSKSQTLQAEERSAAAMKLAQETAQAMWSGKPRVTSKAADIGVAAQQTESAKRMQLFQASGAQTAEERRAALKAAAAAFNAAEKTF